MPCKSLTDQTMNRLPTKACMQVHSTYPSLHRRVIHNEPG